MEQIPRNQPVIKKKQNKKTKKKTQFLIPLRELYFTTAKHYQQEYAGFTPTDLIN